MTYTYYRFKGTSIYSIGISSSCIFCHCRLEPIHIFRHLRRVHKWIMKMK